MKRTLLLFGMVPLALLVTVARPEAPQVSEPAAATQPAPLEHRADPVPPPAPVPSDARPPDPAPPAQTAEPALEAPAPEDEETEREPPATDGPIEAGFVIAPAPTAGAIAGSGPHWRYTIEIDPRLDVDLDTFAEIVRTALTDSRSWARTRTLEQVDDPARARIRVVLAHPDTVDELCGRAGLRTAGIFSCWNGRFAALNSWRWDVGADAFDDLTVYRNYLVNHEFGHGLGYGHVSCPAAGAPAPVMMQQSKGVGACLPNGWPYP